MHRKVFPGMAKDVVKETKLYISNYEHRHEWLQYVTTQLPSLKAFCIFPAFWLHKINCEINVIF